MAEERKDANWKKALAFILGVVLSYILAVVLSFILDVVLIGFAIFTKYQECEDLKRQLKENRQRYDKTRNENTRLKERIDELEKQMEGSGQTIYNIHIEGYVEHIGIIGGYSNAAQINAINVIWRPWE